MPQQPSGRPRGRPSGKNTSLSGRGKSRAGTTGATRRNFLIGSGAGVGLIVAYALWPRTWHGGMTEGEAETLFGPWIKIAIDGRVTVAVPQAEMGQGITSGFAQIVADELGADWQKMAVEPAPFHPLYAQTAVAGRLAADLPAFARGLADHAGSEVARRLNLHMTACSTSITAYHDILREAAAEARQQLIAVAARQWEVNARLLDTRNGVIFYKANRMAFAEAAGRVSPDQLTEAAELRPTASRPLAGKALPRLDLPAKVDGSARFGADVRLPNMVFAAIRHGPPGGRLVSASAPGTVQLVEGPNWVAAVGATNWEARRAVGQIDAEFESNTAVSGADIRAALAEAARSGDGKQIRASGAVDKLLGDEPLNAEYSLPFLAHASLEPMTATARIDQGVVELWGPTQSITLVRRQVAQALGVSETAIRVYPTLIGGGFGRTLEADAFVEAARIAAAVEAPVQLLWDRHDDLSAGFYRPAGHASISGQVDDDGALTALDLRLAAPDAVADFSIRNLSLLLQKSGLMAPAGIKAATEIPYACQALRVTHTAVKQPVPLGLWRGGTHGFSAFVLESFIDELADKAGRDPLAFRLALLADKPRHRAVLQAAAHAASWEEPAPKNMARGLALHESFGSIVAMVVEAGVQDGRIRIGTVASAIDCGQAIAPDSVRAQLEGAAIMGLSAAIGEEQNFTDGHADATDFDNYALLRMAAAPARIVAVIVNSKAALGGAGDPGLPPAAPALANALFRATGKRARNLPLAASYAR